MDAMRENPRRMILIGLVILVLICLVAVLIYRILTAGDEIVGGPIPGSTPAVTAEPAVTTTPAEPTATATHVLSEETVTVVPLAETATPTATSNATPTRPATATAAAPVVSNQGPRPGEIKNLLKNGDFEAGFDQRGLALQWEPFRNDSFQAIYTNETFPYVESGSSAQRITIVNATQGDRYAGLYQQVDVVPNQVYTLTLHGQIRSVPGDINLSSYGYRMQYTVSQAGLKNWENVPAADWIELPWDEQPLNASVTKFYSYTTTLEPASAKITLFVRAWNKWAVPGEAQYTFDSFSLVGPASVAGPLQTSAGAPGTTSITSSTTTTGTTPGGDIIDKGLPQTGAGEDRTVSQDGRFWGGLLILLLLAAGAVYRARWSY
jgi:hypothetical protein